jgi:hypothetical protein
MIFGKDKPKMSDAEKKAKLAALKEANGMATDMLKEGLSGAKKVSVISNSKEGLKKGLEKAEEIVGEQDDECEDCGGEGCPHCAMGEKEQDKAEGYEDQQEESEPMDEDELDEEIQRLMEMKAKLENK